MDRYHDNAAKIRKETGMLTIGVGRINTAELAEQVLEEDKVDLVVMGRAQLVDPEFCNKAKAGKTYWVSVTGEIERMMKNPMIAAMMPKADAMKAHNKEIARKNPFYAQVWDPQHSTNRSCCKLTA